MDLGTKAEAQPLGTCSASCQAHFAHVHVWRVVTQQPVSFCKGKCAAYVDAEAQGHFAGILGQTASVHTLLQLVSTGFP